VLILIGCAFLNSSTKYAFNRDRPPEDLRHRAVLESNKSYPSGHAMASAVGYGLLAYALILPQRHRPRRIAALLLTGGMILAVGFSRIYLRAHWCSDVVAGWTLGWCWLFFCLGWLEVRRRKWLTT
jgi:undecaprenyl-diphosphatase